MKKFIFATITSLVILNFYPHHNIFASDTEHTKVLVKYKNDKFVNKKNRFNSIKKNKKHKTEILTVTKKDLKNTIGKIKEDTSVEYVEPEIKYSFTSEPNDPLYQQSQKSVFDLIDANKAWDIFKPQKKPIVAIIDSGVDMNHSDLKNMLVNPYNILDPTQPPIDNLGHGTHVAGIVGAQTNNSIGIASISKGVSIMPIKVGDDSSLTSINIGDGIYYAVDHGANVINLSLSGPYSQYIEDACNYAYSKGVLIVAAAGNDATSDKEYPAALRNVEGVAAIDNNNKLADFSNYGNWISIAAPGVDILSTYPSNTYTVLDGTSMASPMVASLAAMLKNEIPSLSLNQMRWVMESSSVSYSGDEQNMNGRIDAYNALNLLNNYSRIFGLTSVETSNNIANYGWTNVSTKILKPKEPSNNQNLLNQEGKFVILSSNQSFTDSLAAGALSNMLDAPILVTFPDQLKSSTLNQLKKLGVTNVIILGGTSAVHQNVEDSLTKNNYNVIRISGNDRFRTAVSIDDYVAKSSGTVIVANGLNFPDAISISSYAAKNQLPIVFVNKDTIPYATLKFLDKYHFSKSIVVGGPLAISDDILSKLPNPIRIGGQDRYDTNIKINEQLNNSDTNGVLVATGDHFPDALVGGVLSAKINYPLLLVKKDSVPSVTSNFISELTRQSDSFGMITLGGEAVVSPSNIWSLDATIYQNYYDKNYSQSYDYPQSVSKNDAFK